MNVKNTDVLLDNKTYGTQPLMSIEYVGLYQRVKSRSESQPHLKKTAYGFGRCVRVLSYTYSLPTVPARSLFYCARVCGISGTLPILHEKCFPQNFGRTGVGNF